MLSWYNPVSEGHYTQLHVYSSTQGATIVQRSVAEALGKTTTKTHVD